MAGLEELWLCINMKKLEFTYILSILTLILTFTLFALLFFINIKDNHKDIVIYILGSLTTLLSQIFSFYFGSKNNGNNENNNNNKFIQDKDFKL